MDRKFFLSILGDALCGCVSYSVFLGIWSISGQLQQHTHTGFNRWPWGDVVTTEDYR